MASRAKVGSRVTTFLPVPPGSGKDKDARWVDIYEGELDEEQMAEWVRQAAAQPGWDGFRHTAS